VKKIDAALITKNTQMKIFAAISAAGEKECAAADPFHKSKIRSQAYGAAITEMWVRGVRPRKRQKARCWRIKSTPTKTSAGQKWFRVQRRIQAKTKRL
jgi:hypothetical protein